MHEGGRPHSKLCGALNLELRHAALEGARLHAEQFCGPTVAAHAPFHAVEDRDDVVALDVDERQAGMPGGDGSRTTSEDRSSSAVRWQQSRPVRRRCAVRGRSPATDNAAMPSMLSFETDSIGLAKAVAELVHEAPHEHGNVVRTLAEGRNTNRKDVQTVIEVLAERALRDALLQITVRRRHDANVHIDRTSSCRAARSAVPAGRAAA